ncbi:hypothetical protein CHLNCDRAFT_142386 [Chlorella variabilis]|uniref:MICOS complex subunit MIC10 n=1 Tax=Chlorella variabilis TaxID=554065 RepID=E1Z8F5_CHLVA|nr:hypothetical protein CHLNCDRAFT_142386 [Chlorella variabilis]EFN58082.1 hypothetical protein CHLNCDRAFT_142386 [Chlorella variabilis]|eukprot:XP_005850184.1 hypothetical protein CHLNCDRAFT_142386 [Chlorella variabilis]
MWLVEHQSSLSSRGEDVGTECRAEQPAGVATAAAMSSSSGEVKQHFTDRRWDEALDLMLRRLCYGTLAGGVAGFLLLRAPTARATALGVGAGFGLGSAYQKNQDLFHEIFGVQPDASKKGST